VLACYLVGDKRLKTEAAPMTHFSNRMSGTPSRPDQFAALVQDFVEVWLNVSERSTAVRRNAAYRRRSFDTVCHALVPSKKA